MSQLHIFNPSHDEALAAHTPFYYPAKAARILGDDLSVLPAWWANPGDKILLPEEVDIPCSDFTKRGVEFVHLSNLKTWGKSIEKICPWGWDALLVKRLQKAGISPDLVPDNNQLEDIRNLSSRLTSVNILKAVRKTCPQTIGESYWCTSEEEVKLILDQYQNIMVKAPWSSSGRGVFVVNCMSGENVIQRIRRILLTQGAVEVEPLYNRISDFATEFYATAEGVEYRGLSVFDTNENGAYTGNIIGKEALLFQKFPSAIQNALPDIIKSLTTHLYLLLKNHYVGPLGIDMMCVRGKNDEILLHPCVEVNLRQTMGHVAIDLQSLVPDGKLGIYSVRPKRPQQGEIVQLTPQSLQMEAILQIDVCNNSISH